MFNSIEESTPKFRDFLELIEDLNVSYGMTYLTIPPFKFFIISLLKSVFDICDSFAYEMVYYVFIWLKLDKEYLF